jgi:MFS family permease
MTTSAERVAQIPYATPPSSKKIDDARSKLPSSPTASVHPWSLYSPWQRWGFLAILFLVTISNYFDYFVLSVVLEPIKNEFHVSDTKLGLLSGACFALIYATAALPIARWADRGDRTTVIALALAGWSAMTAACGLAQSFWQLALARFGVGIAEPGAVPPSQSLVADYFPPERRATAITVLTNGASAVGWFVGIGLGGYIAARHGWRVAFLMAGVPGLALAAIVKLVLAEPRRQLGFPRTGAHAESFGQSMNYLRRKRSFVFTLVGVSVYCIFAYGITVFVPSFMIRSLHTTLEQVSMSWGSAIAAANIVGAVIGGRVADRLSRRDVRWYAWLPAIACTIGLPLYWLALLSERVWVFISVEVLAELVLSVGAPVAFVAVLAVCGSRRRSLASAAVYCSMVLIGGTLGPFLSGALSDAFHSTHGFDSLRYSLLALCGFLIPAAAAFFAAARALPQDLED